jgi:hypothetical protein
VSTHSQKAPFYDSINKGCDAGESTLLHIDLNNYRLEAAKKRIAMYLQDFRKDGTRVRPAISFFSRDSGLCHGIHDGPQCGLGFVRRIEDKWALTPTP